MVHMGGGGLKKSKKPSTWFKDPPIVKSEVKKDRLNNNKKNNLGSTYILNSNSKFEQLYYVGNMLEGRWFFKNLILLTVIVPTISTAKSVNEVIVIATPACFKVSPTNKSMLLSLNVGSESSTFDKH